MQISGFWDVFPIVRFISYLRTLLWKMTEKKPLAWFWLLLLLPGLLGSWGGWVSPHFSDEPYAGHSSKVDPAGLKGNPYADSKSNEGDHPHNPRGADQESNSEHSNLPVSSPLFLSMAHPGSLSYTALLGPATSNNVLNWFFKELNRCGIHTYKNQLLSSRHISCLWQRTLRLRTWFTCIMPAQAP